MSIDISEDRDLTLSERVAAQIRAVMGFRGIRQSALARRIGKGEQWLSVRLRGVQPIDLNDLDLIARGLNVEPADLMQPGAVLALLGGTRTSQTRPGSPTVGYLSSPMAIDVPAAGGPLGRARVGRPPGRSDGRRPDDQRTARTSRAARRVA